MILCNLPSTALPQSVHMENRMALALCHGLHGRTSELTPDTSIQLVGCQYKNATELYLKNLAGVAHASETKLLEG